MTFQDEPTKAKPVPLSAVYLLLPTAACFGFILIWPKYADALDHFAGLLGGYAALVGAVFVAVKGA